MLERGSGTKCSGIVMISCRNRTRHTVQEERLVRGKWSETEQEEAAWKRESLQQKPADLFRALFFQRRLHDRSHGIVLRNYSMHNANLLALRCDGGVHVSSHHECLVEARSESRRRPANDGRRREND